MECELTVLQELQKIELEMLEEFKRICDKNNLKYFLIEGTLLGAVRHSGFIPWDDDIDVGMPRPDYERFSQIVDAELAESYLYQDWKKEPDYPYNFAKIRKKGTRFLQKELGHLQMNHGIYIDIFPLDRAPKDPDEQRKYIKQLKKQRVLQSVVYMGKYNGDKKRPLHQRALISVAKTLFRKKNMHMKLDNMLKKYENSDTEYWGNLLGVYGEKEIMPMDYFSETVELAFEQKVYSCPGKYKECLTRLYGNYMQLPPENERVTHHETTVIEFQTE